MGADDYISKPFSQRLLIARIRAILRRADYSRPPDSEEAAKAAEPIVRGRLEMAPARQRVKWGGNDVTLTGKALLNIENLDQTPGGGNKLQTPHEHPHPDTPRDREGGRCASGTC